MCLIDDVLSYTWMFPEEKVCNFTSKILQWFKFKHKTLRFPRTWSTCMYLVSCGLLYFTTLIQEFASPVPVPGPGTKYTVRYRYMCTCTTPARPNMIPGTISIDSTSNYQVHTASTGTRVPVPQYSSSTWYSSTSTDYPFTVHVLLFYYFLKT